MMNMNETSMSPEIKEHVNYITDVFSCADGGIGYTIFLRAVEKWEREDSPAARELIQAVRNFSRLLSIITDLDKIGF